MSLHSDPHQSRELPGYARAGHSVRHTAEILDLSERSTYRAISAGVIRAVKIGGKVIVPTDEIRRPVTPAQEG